MLITEEYRALNRELHGRGVEYGMLGHRWKPLVEGLVHAHDYTSVLDYGCGGGTLKTALALNDCRIDEYDPAIPGKDGAPSPADLVVCGDVLEHIERDCLDAVLDHLQGLARHAALLVVSTVPAKKTLADGRNAHLIVEHPTWWLNRFLTRWDLQRFERDRKGFVVLMVPHR